MRNLLLFIRRFYPFFLFLLLEVISTILISRSNSYHGSRLVNSANQLTGSFYEAQNSVTEYFDLKETNDLLVNENARLHEQLSKFQELARKDSLSVIDSALYEFIPATVINHTTHKKLNYFTLDKGQKQGLDPGMGVIDPSNGIVGILTSVSQGYAVGMSMLNSKIRVSVRHGDSGKIGIMRWKGTELTRFVVEDITRTAVVEIGDVFVTSGYSTFFPAGREVARVVSVESREGSNFWEIEAVLTNDILSLNQVYVVQRIGRAEIDSLETITQ